ncbi:MAG: hypothetical protein ACT6RZ_03295 [Methylophilus sp.]|uniref:hypothetical protein n=2 Tax=Methylophilus sp. TaxID=29541 RepID=UPI00403513BE
MISDIQLCSRFIDTLDWICQVLVRHADDFNIALVKIAYGDDNSLGEAYGAPEALRQLSSLTHDLQNSFRKSDLVGREGTDFWILFPYTRVTDNVYDKLMDVLQGSAHNNLNIVQREVAIFELPVIYQKADIKPEDGLALLQYAKANQAELASHIFRLESVES